MSDNSNWTLIFTSEELYQVKIAEDILKQNGIGSNIINKHDSAIPSLGVVELYARVEDAEKAVDILKESEIKLH